MGRPFFAKARCLARKDITKGSYRRENKNGLETSGPAKGMPPARDEVSSSGHLASSWERCPNCGAKQINGAAIVIGCVMAAPLRSPLLRGSCEEEGSRGKLVPLDQTRW
jgi:hypothetical protein